MKIKWHPILIGLSLLLVSAIVLASGCTNEPSETNCLKSGPLEPPFSEIIPSAEDLYVDIHLEHWKTSDITRYCSDGSILHSRFIGTEACFGTPADGSEDSTVAFLNMVIYDYQIEKEAIEQIRKEKQSEFHKKIELYNGNDTEFYAKIIGLPLEDIAAYTHFWKDPYVVEVQGETEVFFRVGQYVGAYTVHIDDPPNLEDGYFLPLDLDDLLEAAVETTIPKLRSIVTP